MNQLRPVLVSQIEDFYTWKGKVGDHCEMHEPGVKEMLETLAKAEGHRAC